MSLVDHDVVCFALNQNHRICWLIEVDLRKKELGAVALYINEEGEKQAAEEEQPSTYFFGNSFISSQFTMYLDKHACLDKHAIKSVSFSKKLEETNLKRAVEKGWIQDPEQVVV